MVNSIAKGKASERQFARILERITKVKWNRVSCSGGMATAQGIHDSRFQGDLWSEDKNYQTVIIECKAGKKNVRLEDIKNPKSIFWSWINQTRNESEGKDWALLFKTNFGDSFIVANTTSKFMLDISDRIVIVAYLPGEPDLVIGCLDG